MRFAKAAALDDRAPARRDRGVSAVEEERPQRQLNAVAARPGAIAEAAERRLQATVLRWRDHVLEIDVAAGTARRFSERDQPVQLVVQDSESSRPAGRWSAPGGTLWRNG